jgi:hypothetical protein
MTGVAAPAVLVFRQSVEPRQGLSLMTGSAGGRLCRSSGPVRPMALIAPMSGLCVNGIGLRQVTGCACSTGGRAAVRLVTFAAFPVSQRRSALLRPMAMLAFDGDLAPVGFVAVLTLTVALACHMHHVFVASGAAHGELRRPMGEPAVATRARLMSRECLHQG